MIDAIANNSNFFGYTGYWAGTLVLSFVACCFLPLIALGVKMWRSLP